MFSYFLLLRNILDSITNIIISIILNIFYIRTIFIKFYKANNDKRRIHILGNGPSIKDDYKILKSILNNDDKILCVNMFINSPLFQEIKPDLYVLVDPLYFTTLIGSEKQIGNIWKNLQENTSWNLTLFIPANYRNSDNIKYIKQNPLINIIFLKNVPIYNGFLCVNAFLFRVGIANPLFQNVLIASIYISIKADFREIFLWGTDHTWLENVTVGSDNKIYIKDTHFYDIYGKPERFAANDDKMRVDISLASYQRCFRLYHDLKQYALLKKCKIINCSSVSWIDAFERLNK